MKIGKATVPRTAICTSDEHTIVIRGRDLARDLIGRISFVDHFFLLLVGRLPSAGETAALAVMRAWRAAGQAIPGYGHPLHKERDTRVGALFDAAKHAGTDLRFVQIAEAAEALIPEVLQRELKLNVSGAIPAVLLGA